MSVFLNDLKKIDSLNFNIDKRNLKKNLLVFYEIQKIISV